MFCLVFTTEIDLYFKLVLIVTPEIKKTHKDIKETVHSQLEYSLFLLS